MSTTENVLIRSSAQSLLYSGILFCATFVLFWGFCWSIFLEYRLVCEWSIEVWFSLLWSLNKLISFIENKKINKIISLISSTKYIVATNQFIYTCQIVLGRRLTHLSSTYMRGGAGLVYLFTAHSLLTYLAHISTSVLFLLIKHHCYFIILAF